LATVRARQLLVRELTRVRGEYGFLLIGCVVMPEHVHLLISEPGKGTPSTVLQMLKQWVSGKMRKKAKCGWEKQLRLAFAEPVETLRCFWQARFYDFKTGCTAQPGDARIGEGPKRLAVEQLVLLREK
jgi:REP element-mobilizing transposase RayT